MFHKHFDGKFCFYLAPQHKGFIAELVAEYESTHTKAITDPEMATDLADSIRSQIDRAVATDRVRCARLTESVDVEHDFFHDEVFTLLAKLAGPSESAKSMGL